jgi:hypothetical protein
MASPSFDSGTVLTSKHRARKRQQMEKEREMVAQAWNSKACKDEIEQEGPLCVAEGERLGLYDIVEEAGPVTAFGLAFKAMIPVSLALRWLTAQVEGGYGVRDVATGRYRTWCVLPDPDEEAGS